MTTPSGLITSTLYYAVKGYIFDSFFKSRQMRPPFVNVCTVCVCVYVCILCIVCGLTVLNYNKLYYKFPRRPADSSCCCTNLARLLSLAHKSHAKGPALFVFPPEGALLPPRRQIRRPAGALLSGFIVSRVPRRARSLSFYVNQSAFCCTPV